VSEHGLPATVIGMAGDNVLVEIPMRGFPPRFQLYPGQRVMIMVEDTGLAATPLIEAYAVSDSSADIVSKGSVVINGETYEVQPGVTDSNLTSTPGTYVAVIDHGSATGPKQIFGIRPQ
jgi:hypothetical protein